MRSEVVSKLQHQLIVSCQPLRGGVFDEPALVARFVKAAEAGGAAAVRIESLADLKHARQATERPVIGLIKRSIPASPIYITPELADVDALAQAGADIIAFDATRRPRPCSVQRMIAGIHAAGCLAMADISSYDEGLEAMQAGAELIGTTLSGYTPYSPAGSGPDLDLVAQLAERGIRVIAEGRISTPKEAADALAAGAFAVTVGTAISRPELITEAFVTALGNAHA